MVARLSSSLSLCAIVAPTRQPLGLRSPASYRVVSSIARRRQFAASAAQRTVSEKTSGGRPKAARPTLQETAYAWLGMVCSAIFFMDLKGKILISRNYRGDVSRAQADK